MKLGLTFAWAVSLIAAIGTQTVFAQTADNNSSAGKDIYPASYFDQFSPVTAADMLDRIPGITFILQNGGGGNRGFGTNRDRVLIDGRRVSGKETNGRVVLERIAASQVRRIEILRVGSTEAENRTLDTQVNVVLKPSAGEGTWEAALTRYRGDIWRPGGKLTYAGSIRNIDYSLAFSGTPRLPRVDSVENVFQPNLQLTQREVERFSSKRTDLSGAGDITVDGDRSGVFRLNGIYIDRTGSSDFDEAIFLNQNGVLLFDSVLFEDNKAPRSRWEVGGDYVRPLGQRFELKLLGLHNVTKNNLRQESGSASGTGSLVTQRLNSDRLRTESVVRLGLAWDVSATQDLEIGVEGAQNTLDAKLEISELVGSQFVPVDIDLSDSRVRENRAEVFIVHNWRPWAKWNLQSSLVAEFSTISQVGPDIDASRSFEFLKPAVEIRFDASRRDKIEFSIERRINQLGFGDFVASLNDAVDIFDEGNPDVVQEKDWALEAIWDRKLRDDGSTIRTQIFYDFVEDVIEQVATPGTDIGTAGNVGGGRRYGFKVELSLKLDWIGIPGAIFEGRYEREWSRVSDPFTGMKRRFSSSRPYRYRVELRQDVPRLNFYYGLFYSKGATNRNFFINEVRSFRRDGFMGTFAEYRFENGWAFRVDASNLLNGSGFRDRDIYVGRVSSGVIDRFERRTSLEGRVLKISLRGTF